MRKKVLKTRSSKAPSLLPTQKSKPAKSLEDYIILVSGEKKIGKTTMLSHYGEAFFFMWEPGGRALSIYQKPMGDWPTFVKHVSEFKTSHFHSGIVDTVDLAYHGCLESTCRRMGIEHPTEEGYGKGWDAVRRAFTKTMLRDLGSSGKGIVFTSHVEEKTKMNRRGEKTTIITATMPGQARSVIEGAIDIWCYYHYDGTDRYLQIQGDDVVSCGHRVEGRFLYTDGTPIRQIPMGTSSEEAFRNFNDAFNNRLKKGGVGKGKVVRKVSKKKTTVRKKRRS